MADKGKRGIFSKAALLAIAAFVGVSSVFGAGIASGSLLGGKWPYSGSGDLTLYWSYGGGHRYLGNAYQGAANWTHTATPIVLTQRSSNSQPLNIAFADVYWQDRWWGETIFANAPCYYCVPASFTKVYIYMNQRAIEDVPQTAIGDFMRTAVATHELGHALGLAHPTGNNLPDQSIMYQGILSYNMPQPYDVSEINRLYPTSPPPPPPPPPPGSVAVSKGAHHTVPGCNTSPCAYVTVTLSGFAAGSHTVNCYSDDPYPASSDPYYTYTTSSNVSNVCVYGYPGYHTWVTVDGVESNHLTW